MKFKLLAIAAVMAVSGAANAATIDNGAANNGGLFFQAWDASSSYTLNLNTRMDAFESTVAAAGLVNMSWAADTTFTNFLSTADMASLQWNVQAVDNMGARRFLNTFTAPAPMTTKGNDIIRVASGAVVGTVNAVNVYLKANSSDSAVIAVGNAGYAGILGNNAGGRFGLLNFSNSGTVANNTFDSGLNFMRINAMAGGIAKSTYTTYTDDGVDVKFYLDNMNTLHVTAVPEPETFAMLLAGLGLMGAIARRRNKKSA